jgi:hypothetical protein
MPANEVKKKKKYTAYGYNLMDNNEAYRDKILLHTATSCIIEHLIFRNISACCF